MTTPASGAATHDRLVVRQRGPVADREKSVVELVDSAGRPTGTTSVARAHEAPGLLHRAFSVLLFDSSGRVLLQRRAAAKTRFAMRWANACCGHPTPGGDVADAATRRLSEELGLGVNEFTEVGRFVYRAADEATQRVEHEYDHVLTGAVDAAVAMTPDPAEVADLRWVGVGELDEDLLRQPANYAPWLAGVLKVWRTARRQERLRGK